MAKASAYGGRAVVTSATARRDTLLADQTNPDSLDAMHGSFFCDSTTGLTIAEPGGGDQDEAGFIPADAGNNIGIGHPRFPDCTSLEVVSIAVVDPNGNTFAVPGVNFP